MCNVRYRVCMDSFGGELQHSELIAGRSQMAQTALRSAPVSKGKMAPGEPRRKALGNMAESTP